MPNCWAPNSPGRRSIIPNSTWPTWAMPFGSTGPCAARKGPLASAITKGDRIMGLKQKIGLVAALGVLASGSGLLAYDGDAVSDARYQKRCLGCDLSEAPFQFEDLSNADLKGSNLANADLENSNLAGADLTGANLTGANLDNANLVGANLSGAKLMGANLQEANLKGANLDTADLSNAKMKL